MIALFLFAAQTVEPPLIVAPSPVVAPMPPQDWSVLPPLRTARRTVDQPDVSAFVKAETLAGRCAKATPTTHGWTLTVDLAVLAAPDGRIRRVTPRAIDCPTVEQYAAGLVLRAARDAVDTGDATAETWYRTSMTFAWGA